MTQQTNQREIKFRAWDIDFEKMVYSSEFKTLSEFFSYLERRRKPHIAVGYLGIQQEQQFSGMQDVNGKDIYEGDVISKLRHRERGNWASERIHDPNYFEYVVFRRGNFCTQSEDSLFQYIYSIVNHKVEAEIIGNIYENNELLK